MQFGVVLVTFNRLSELKKTIRLYEQQTFKPAYILVVDNCSTDGTAEFLEAWKSENSGVERKLISLPQNTGGSGGFHAGLQAAVQLDADWIWLADDDAYPKENVFAVMRQFAEEHADMMEEAAALCTKNYGEHGIAVGHRCRTIKSVLGAHEIPVSAEEYDKEYFDVDMYSFVGAVIRKSAVLKAGLPRKDFFIYADDAEHALRIRKTGRILCVPAAEVYHNDNNSYSREASWRDYYATRNILLVNRWHHDEWSYQVRKVCRLLTACRSLNPEKIKVFCAAMKDAKNEVLGVHPIYRPGWQPARKLERR